MQEEATLLYSAYGDDPDLGELVQLFVEEMPDRIENLSQLFENDDPERLACAAHQLKGSAGGYGFHQITPFAKRLELSVRSGASRDEIHTLLDDLVAICRSVRAGTRRL